MHWLLHLVAGEADPVLSVRAAVATRLLEVQARAGEGLDSVQVRAPRQWVDHVQRLQVGEMRDRWAEPQVRWTTNTHTEGESESVH